MHISPIGHSLSFGQKNENNKSTNLTLPLTATGAIAGAAVAHATRIKADAENLDSFISTVGEKLPMSSETKESFETFKSQYEGMTKPANEIIDKRLEKLGLSDEVDSISTEDAYKKIIHPDTPQKNMEGLDAEIKYINNEIIDHDDRLAKTTDPAEKTKLLAERTQEITDLKEKKDFKAIIEGSKEEKITVDNVKDHYLSTIKKDPKIKNYTEEFSNLTKKFNKQRLAIFTAVGAAVGIASAYFLKKDDKQ